MKKPATHLCLTAVSFITALIFFTLPSCGSAGGQGAATSPSLPPPSAPPQIFKSYSKDRDATMADGWARGMDMSGVAFDDDRTATLITPRHVVMAKHFSRAPGAAVIFHDRSGDRIERKLIALSQAAGDVMVGLLDAPVPANFHPYPLPSPSSSTAALLDRHVIVTDQERCLFIHRIAIIEAGVIAFKQDESKLHGWGKNLIVGDSGNPSFVISGNQLVLVETHTNGGAGSGPFYGDPTVQASVRAAVATLDPSFQIKTVSLK